MPSEVSEPTLHERRAAQLSVNFHALHPRGADLRMLPAELRPLELGAAADILHRDVRRPSHRERAAVKLVAAGLHRHESHRESLRKLLSPKHSGDATADAARRIVEKAAEIVTPDLDVVGAVHKAIHFVKAAEEGAPRPAAEREQAPQASAASAPTPCLRRLLLCDAHQDLGDLVSRVKVRVGVDRHLDDLRELFVPEKWGLLNEEFFGGTEPVKPVGERDPDLFELFENVHVSWAGSANAVSTFKNILNIARPQRREDHSEPRWDQGGWKICYSLNRSIESRSWLDYRSGGVDVDNGYMMAWTAPINASAAAAAIPESASRSGTTRSRQVASEPIDAEPGQTWSVVEIVKNVRFTTAEPGRPTPGVMNYNMMLNYLAPAVVTTWLEGLVYEGVAVEKS